jgi:hypothetical protein
MLQSMQETMINLHAQPKVPPPPRDRLGDFQRTKPLTFSHVVEPMNADDWIKFVEKKLQVVQYNNHEKVLLCKMSTMSFPRLQRARREQYVEEDLHASLFASKRTDNPCIW